MITAAEFLAEADVAEVELKSEASIDDVLVVVASEERDRFTSSRSIDRLEELTSLIRRGGQPIGLICVKRTSGGFQFPTRVFSKYKSAPWARQYLNEIVDKVRDVFTEPIDSKKLN